MGQVESTQPEVQVEESRTETLSMTIKNLTPSEKKDMQTMADEEGYTLGEDGNLYMDAEEAAAKHQKMIDEMMSDIKEMNEEITDNDETHD